MELINHDDGTWSLGKVSELEHLMLTRLPAAADPTGCEEAQNRLYPSPLAPTADVDDNTSAGLEEDWREYIVPDLRQSFGDALKIVSDDLARGELVTDGETTAYDFNIPKAHADHWCSALNQARLVLHYRHNLPDQDGELDGDLDPEKWMAMLQTEIYSILMSFLITRVLWIK